MELAAQLIVFGPNLTKLLPDAFCWIRDAGFKAVEGGHLLMEMDPNELKQMLADTSLHLSAFHCTTHHLMDGNSCGKHYEFLHALDCQHFICSGILDGYGRMDSYVRTADLLAKRYEEAGLEGISLSYHHHDWELRTVFGAKLGLQVILEKALEIDLVIDTYWAMEAGVTLERLWHIAHSQPHTKHRCHNVHLKDGIPRERLFHPLGHGETKVADDLGFILGKNLDYITWEQDTTSEHTIRESIEISGRWLKQKLSEWEGDGNE